MHLSGTASIPPSATEQLATLNFTAVDFETANASRGSVCAAGIVKVVGGRVVHAEDSLVRPPAGLDTFDPRMTRIHGLRARDVAEAPTWPILYQRLMEIAGDDVLVAHNSSFDMSVITAANAACDIEADRPRSLCTVKLARGLLPGLANHKLPTVSEHLKLAQFDHHDAGADAMACAGIAIGMARLCQAGSLHELAAAAGVNW